jgi:hypothetical protein
LPKEKLSQEEIQVLSRIRSLAKNRYKFCQVKSLAKKRYKFCQEIKTVVKKRYKFFHEIKVLPGKDREGR